MQQNRKAIAGTLLCSGLGIALSAFLFLSTSVPLQIESPARIVIGAMMVFVVPGLLWGEIIGFRARHTLEVIAISALVSLVIAFILLIPPLMMATRIDAWVFGVLAVSSVGLMLCVRRLIRGQPFRLVAGLFGRSQAFLPGCRMTSQLAMTAIVAILSWGAYRWGEDMFDLGREKFLHAVYVRYYFDMPLDVSMIFPVKGVASLNIIQFWEFLMAGWAKLAGMDPLPLYCRARFVVPILGLSGVYLTVRRLFVSRFKAEFVFWIVLLLAAGFFMLHEPSSFDVVRCDPTRGAFCFMGVNHHAETAVEILLPLGMALLLMCLKQPNLRNYVVLIGFLGVTLLWHAREFFQLGISMGIFAAVLLIYPWHDRMTSIRRLAIVISAFVLTALAYLFVSGTIVSHESLAYDEGLIKRTALAYAFTWESLLSVRSFFNFPTIYLIFGWGNLEPAIGVHGLNRLSGANYFAPLITAALAVPIIVAWGRKDDRRAALWLLLLWLCFLCWNFSMLMILFVSYAEIFMWPVRHIHLLAYIVTGAGVFWIASRAYERYSRSIVKFLFLCLIMACAGYYFDFWLRSIMMRRWGGDIRLFSLVMWTSLVYLLAARPFGRRDDGSVTSVIPERKRGAKLALMLGLSCTALFPVIGNDLAGTFYRCATFSRPDMQWFSRRNVFGLSEELLRFVRALPQRQHIMVDPQGRGALALFAPHYLDVLPAEISAIFVQYNARFEAIRGRHILFNPQVAKGIGDAVERERLHAALREYIRAKEIDCIFVEKRFYAALRPFFETYREEFAIVFDNPVKGEMIVQCVRAMGK